jgi:transcriptional regulator with XRE-family HTH domain
VANENLRAALQQAGLQPDELAQIVQVDIRTVRRWLSGRTPYPRQRGKVARALDTTEHDLWPEIATAPPPSPPAGQATDMLAAYPAASDLAAPEWKALMRDAAGRIELLGDTLIPVLGAPGVPELLATKATDGCDVRLLVYDAGRELVPLLDQAGIEIRLLQVPARYTIHRFDEQLLLTLHLLGEDADQAPLVHLRRAAPGGLFDRFAEHYNDLWEQDSQPINPDVDLVPDDEDEDDGENPESGQPLPYRCAAGSQPQRPPRTSPATLAPATIGSAGLRSAIVKRHRFAPCARVPAAHGTRSLAERGGRWRSHFRPKQQRGVARSTGLAVHFGGRKRAPLPAPRCALRIGRRCEADPPDGRA